MIRLPVSLVVLFAFMSAAMVAQTPNVRMYIQQVAAGWTSDAKKALPDLLIEQPDDPGVLFLHASLIDDAKKASPLLERVVSVFPKSEWADDALARLIVISATKNDSDKARRDFAKMREQYSQSELLPIVFEVMRASVGAPPPSDKAVAQTPKKNDASPTASEIAPTKSSAKPYTLITRATFSKDEADALLESFKKKRMRARIATDSQRNKTRYVVSVGEYESEPDALRDVEAVRAICKCKPRAVKQ